MVCVACADLCTGGQPESSGTHHHTRSYILPPPPPTPPPTTNQQHGFPSYYAIMYIKEKYLNVLYSNFYLLLLFFHNFFTVFKTPTLPGAYYEAIYECY